MTKKHDSTVETEETQYWRSLGDKEGKPSFSAEKDYEYTPTQQELDSFTEESSEQKGWNRRQFIGAVGASAALAAAGCIRKPVERILPYNKRPEEIIPGNPIQYATAMSVMGQVIGLLVESQEGRPTKIEGNPDHPNTQGTSSVWAQSAILDLYDADRSKNLYKGGKVSDWKSFQSALNHALNLPRKNKGEGLSLLVESQPSPSHRHLLSSLKKKYPSVKVYRHDPVSEDNQAQALALLGMAAGVPSYSFDKADVVFSLGNDFLGIEGETLQSNREFMSVRKDPGHEKDINRLYSVETNFTLTGAAADNRLSVRHAEAAEFLATLTLKVLELSKTASKHQSLTDRLKQRVAQFKGTNPDLLKSWSKWLSAIAEDLVANQGKSLVVIGKQYDTKVHALGFFLNNLLGNIGKGKALRFFPNNKVQAGNATELAKSIRAGSVQALVILGSNPVYSAPSDLDFASLLQQVPFSVHHGLYRDETGEKATWHIPATHFLEAWGDLESPNGVVSIQQPLIAPLYSGRSGIELMSSLLGATSKGHKLVRDYWRSKGVDGFERKWKKWLHDGVIKITPAKMVTLSLSEKDLAGAWKGSIAKKIDGHIELNFVADSSVLDGRFANNAWLQELPDPMSKLTWDNAAYINPKTARERSLKDGDLVTLEANNQAIEIPVFQVPGIATNALILPLGYGRQKAGRVAAKIGFNVYPLRTTFTLDSIASAKITKKDYKSYKLATTQEFGRLEIKTPFKTFKRDSIYRQASFSDYKKDPKFVEKYEVIKDKSQLRSLWDDPSGKKTIWSDSNERYAQQWGMSIDLNLCTGCNTCTIACQAENNIPVVGKERVDNGRVMHWIRLDRYYTGDEEKGNLSAVVQPIACVHCENAPCENVCPVAATVHGIGGTNDMAYNRCIGTRYCLNNCPYKVRRFNFFNYQKENDELLPTLQMQRNPDVTVRFRGVMEKCTYCIQRINEAKIEAKTNGDGIIQDGKMATACEQACPTKAITFGDINDKKSRVAKAKHDSRNYALLAELNIKPRTSYLAKIRNPNPKLV